MPIASQRELRAEIVDISPHLLIELFKQGQKISHEIVENGLPEDAKLVGCRYDAILQVLELGVESESFAPIPEGCAAPHRKPPVARQIVSD